MKNTECYLCNNTVFRKVQGKVRDLPEVQILRCTNCGLVFLENFDHIDAQFYNQSRMREHDEIVHQEWRTHLIECLADDTRRAEWMRPLALNKSILDFGCGGGGFLLMIKDIAGKCNGIEKDDTFKKILNEQYKIKTFDDVDDCSDKYDLITLFHVVEHLKDPKKILTKLANKLTENGKIIIEVPNADDALLSLYKSKDFSEFSYWSCHLFLFNNYTLKMMVESIGLKINYIKQIQRYPLSNHLFWLTNGKPGGHTQWDFLDNELLNKQYELQLANLGIADTIIASISK